ncbi:MAG: DUF1553 domain-containing protein [Planctomycetota bacterium]|nr:DUF1553 domain-containing protein [Planctomycetota bacterium]MDA0919734.1 DUF1553 domain-containing protein [Planctomycetota bacterium]MDA1159745.1 DUF1553 domain-containing protein [Planctomycetota bacterium]
MPKNRILKVLFAVQLSLFVGSLMPDGAAGADQSVVGSLTRLEVFPEQLELTGPRSTAQLVVTGYRANGEVVDVSSVAEFVVTNHDLLDVSESGRLTPKRDGETQLQVSAGGVSTTLKAQVAGQQHALAVSFEHETLPVLAKAGCSGGACHGSPHGKGEFRLSLFGFEPAFDRMSLVKESQSRRVNTIKPAHSLLLRKPTMQIPHAGGRRLKVGDELYSLLHDWIGDGCPVDSPDAACVGIEVHPSIKRVLRFPANTQQFSVRARFADGTIRDVTHLSQFSLSDPNVASVSTTGLITGVRRGETAVIVRYLEFIETPLLTFVEDVDNFAWNNPPTFNYVDEKVDQKLKQLQYQPADVCPDEMFVRRVYLDVIGTLPTIEEVDRFLANQSPGKRKRLIDELLDRPEYSLFWAQKWGDLLRVSRKQIGLESVFKFSQWLQAAVAHNMPYDQFARELLTASGSTITSPAGNYYRTAGETLDAMESTAQLFMGTRIQCAKCHNHPFERWTQSNYYGLASFFNRIERRKTDRPEEVILWTQSSGEVHHPAYGRVMKPWVPVSGELEIAASVDRRAAFSEWLTSPDNPFFARVEVNRIWAQVMGRGIVEPFDDFRDSNPPANAPLLDTLARDFVDHGFDRDHILRTILNSRTYQADSRPSQFNRDDDKYFSHYVPRQLTAEQLVDSLGQVAGKPKQFDFVASDTKATWLPAPDLRPHDRSRLGEVDFLKVFGQPERQSVCECDRGDDSSLGQALELLNGSFMNNLLTGEDNRLHGSVRNGRPTKEVIIELYRLALSRYPTESELHHSLAYAESHADNARALEDICWAIVNKDEFLFQH